MGNKYLNKNTIVIIVCLFVIFIVSFVTTKLVSVDKNEFGAVSYNVTKINDNIAVLQQELSASKSLINNINKSVSESIVQIQLLLEQNKNSTTNDINGIKDSINEQLTNLQNKIDNTSRVLDNYVSMLNGKATLSEYEALKANINSLMVSLQNDVNTMKTLVASMENEIRGTSVEGKVKLIGSNDYNPTTSSGAGYFVLGRFQCTQSGTLSIIRLRVTDYGGVKVGIYSDNNSLPNTLLSSNTYDNIVASGWASVNITPINVVAGNYYWIAYNSASKCIGWTTAYTGVAWYYGTPITYSSFTFPTVINTGDGYNKSPSTVLVSGWSGY